MSIGHDEGCRAAYNVGGLDADTDGLRPDGIGCDIVWWGWG